MRALRQTRRVVTCAAVWAASACVGDSPNVVGANPMSGSVNQDGSSGSPMQTSSSSGSSGASSSSSSSGTTTSSSSASSSGGPSGCVASRATLDDDHRWSEISIDASRLEASTPVGVQGGGLIGTTASRQTGKAYFEATITKLPALALSIAGIGFHSQYDSYNNYNTDLVDGCGYGVGSSNAITCDRTASVYPSNGTILEGDTVQVAVDLSSRRAYFGRNGSWLSGGNPTAGTGGLSYAFTRDMRLSPALSFIREATVRTNFGQDAFRYPVPAGFDPGWVNECASLPTYPPPTGAMTIAGGAACTNASSYTYELATDVEVHALSARGGAPITVNVAANARPVILVLNVLYDTTWTIVAAPGATVQAIYSAAAPRGQTVIAPMGVPVYTRDTYIAGPYPGSSGSRAAVAVREWLGRPLNTGRYCFDAASFTVERLP